MKITSCQIRMEKGSPEPVAYAAEQLQHYLHKAGVAVSSQGRMIIRLRSDVSGLPGGAFRHTVSEKEIEIASSEGCGVVYGAFALLEKMGFRFLTSDCEIIPEIILIPESGINIETPAFAARELFWRDAMDGAFAVRLKLNSARSTITPRQGGKLMFYQFSHTFDKLVPVEKWFDIHPEYFSMRNGKRLRERTQLCLTNPEVLQLCITGVKKWKQEHPDCNIFSVSMNDWYNCCECPECRKVDEEEGSHAGTVIRFVNAVAEELEKVAPDTMIHTFAYLYCRKPPRRVKPRKNVIVRLCSIECCFSHPLGECRRERGGIDVQYGSAANFSDGSNTGESFLADMKGWAAVTENLFIWDYTTNYANYLLPFPNLMVLQPNLQLFHRNGIRGVFEQGNFSLGKTSALGQLKTYLLAKLLWNPYEDMEDLISDFVRGYYGPAEKAMRSYVAVWQNAAGEEHAGIYDMPDANYLTEDLLRKSMDLLEAGLKAADGQAVYTERIQREMLSIRYAMLTREENGTSGHSQRVDDFGRDAKQLGITELFERKDMDASLALMKTCRYVWDRGEVPGISYAI